MNYSNRLNIVQKHINKTSWIISILLHLLLLFLYKELREIQLFPLKKADPINAQELENRLVFELVETPDDAQTDRKPENTNLVSDKNSIARDQNQNKDKAQGNPYSEGDFDVKNLPLPKAELVPSESNSTNQNLDTKSEQAEENQSDEYAGNGYEYQKFSRKMLLANASQSVYSPMQKQPINRSIYDNENFNAEDLGGLTFNTYNWNFAPYLLEMKRKIESNIFPPPAFIRMGLIDGEILLRFKIMPNGVVKDLVVLEYIGHESLKETSIQAILNSSAFKPLPADFPENYLEVTGSFKYYVRRK